MKPAFSPAIADHGPPLRVLVVEDNDSDAMVAQAAVEKALRGPRDVLRAATLANALAIIRREDVGLVLLDLNLPDSRGVRTLSQMRASTGAPIIVVTVEDRPGLDDEALGHGAFEILHKGRLGPDAIMRLLRLAENRHTAQVSLARARSRLELALAASRVCTWDYDVRSGEVVLSDFWAEMTGAPAGETRTSIDALAALVNPEDFASVRHVMAEALTGWRPEYAVEHRVRHSSGEWRWIASRGKIIERDEHGRAVRMAGSNLDISERIGIETRLRESEARLALLTQFDAVTGLANRDAVKNRLKQSIVQAKRSGRGAGVLYIGLDHFKLVNDTLGHPIGDELLVQVGKRLGACVRPDDAVGRIRSDEFAVVIADLASADDAAIVARKIGELFTVPFDLKGHEAYVTASIGGAAFPNDGERTGALLKSAYTAMRRVKESSRNAFCFFAADMNARATSKLQLHTDLHHAAERGEFELHYQPKVDLATGAMIGMEALLRWQHPRRGMVSPIEFIPALENTGLIVPIGDWVIQEARSQLRRWLAAGLAPVPVAVNLSAKQFRRRDLGKSICRALAEQDVSPRLLELEITESCLMDDPADAIRQLHVLREAGLKISVDDFGTGYSSLAYLTRLPLSTLKIDRSFVNAAISDANSAAIVKMVIDMSQSLNFNVVAEGIESENHVAFLRKHHCEQGQGYHFGKPMPAAEIGRRLAKR
jgi:diguanylate cyclase (GGDEF)-like protein